MSLNFDERQTATGIAALRYWQDEITNEDGETIQGRAEELMPEMFDEHAPLDADEISDLCEAINCDDAGAPSERETALAERVTDLEHTLDWIMQNEDSTRGATWHIANDALAPERLQARLADRDARVAALEPALERCANALDAETDGAECFCEEAGIENDCPMHCSHCESLAAMSAAWDLLNPGEPAPADEIETKP